MRDDNARLAEFFVAGCVVLVVACAALFLLSMIGGGLRIASDNYYNMSNCILCIR